MGVILKALYHYLHTYIFIYELQSQKGRKLFHIFKGAEMKLTSNFEHLF